MTTPLPIAAPYTTPLGQVLAGNGSTPPTNYAAAWYQGANQGATILLANASDITGVVGPAALAYLKAQGLAFGSATAVVNLSVNPTSGGSSTVATFTAAGVAGLAPTGQVQFFIDSVLYATVPLPANGTINLAIPTSAFPGFAIHDIQATYLGDRNYLEAQSGIATYDSRALPTFDSFLINGMPTPATFGFGSALIYIATFSFAYSAPTGDVSFWVGDPLGDPPSVYLTVSLVSIGGGSYTATISTTAAQVPSVVGTTTWFAVFNGDLIYMPLSTTTFALTVLPD